jgi:hypothetical protein
LQLKAALCCPRRLPHFKLFAAVPHKVRVLPGKTGKLEKQKEKERKRTLLRFFNTNNPLVLFGFWAPNSTSGPRNHHKFCPALI